MNYDRKRMERIVLIGAVASFICVCGALMHEGIQTVAQEQNGLSEATTGRIEANLSADGGEPLPRETVKADVHKRVAEKKEETRPIPVAEKQADAVHDDEKVCLRADKIVRGFGWQEEDGVWRYHTGIDMAVEDGEVCAVVGGTVHRIERGAGGYLVEVAAEDKLWSYEPLEEVTAMVGDSVLCGERLGRIAISADRLHIACRRGGEWLDPQQATK